MLYHETHRISLFPLSEQEIFLFINLCEKSLYDGVTDCSIKNERKEKKKKKSRVLEGLLFPRRTPQTHPAG